MTWWLEAGEDGSDRLDLMTAIGGSPGYSVMSQGFDIVPDGEDPDRFQILSIPLLIKGSSKNDLFNKRRAILTKLNQASFNRQPGSGQPRVTIAIRFGDADTLVRWVIESGNLTRGNLGAIATNHLGSMDEPAMLQLRCWRGGLGERIDYGPFTVSGADPTLHINGVPGDLPGVLEMHVEDTSTNSVAVNRLIWACRSLPDMADGDFDPVLPFNAVDESVADTFTGGIASISASSTWQTIGSVSRAASVHDGGVFDVYARLRDATAALGVPGSVEATAGESIDKVQSRGANGSGSSADVTWLSPTTTGNLLVLAVRISSNHTVNTPAGWTAGPSVGSGPRAAIFYKANASSESGTVTVTFSGSASDIRLYLAEFRGIAASSPVDVTATNTVTNSTNGATGTTGTTAQANALAVAVWSTSASTGGAVALPGGWSVLNDSGAPEGHAGFRVLTTTGTQSGTATHGLGTTDWSNLIVVFKGLVTAPGAVSANGYTVRVVAVDASGGLSAPSSQTVVTLTGTGSIYVEWEAASGPVAQYRVYLRADDGDWEYYETGSTATNYTITSDTSDGTADPPATTTISAGQFRAFIGRENSATQQPAIGPFTASVANSEWEWVYLRRVHLPPSSTPGVAGMTDWTLVLQGRADTSTQLDADAILLLPADENSTVDACYPPNSLTTPHEWHVWATPQGVPGGYLTDGTDEAGNLRVRGVPSIGPGDTTMTFVPSVAGGISNVEDVEFDVSVYVWPRYEWLVGEV